MTFFGSQARISKTSRPNMIGTATLSRSSTHLRSDHDDDHGHNAANAQVAFKSDVHERCHPTGNRYCEPIPAHPSALPWRPRRTSTDSTDSHWHAPTARLPSAPPSPLPSMSPCPKGSRLHAATGARPDVPPWPRRRTWSYRRGNRSLWPTAGVVDDPPRRRLRTWLSPSGIPSEENTTIESRYERRTGAEIVEGFFSEGVDGVGRTGLVTIKRKTLLGVGCAQVGVDTARYVF